MKPYYSKDGISIYCGDNLEVMAELEVESIDSVLTDPPYNLGFMGKVWDSTMPGKATWDAALRVCKPGAMLLSFGGTRTQHRLTCAIEDAGWEIRDCLMWLYGSGFPKSLDISKAIDRASGNQRETEYVPNLKNKNYGKGLGGGKWNAKSAPAVEKSAKEWSGWGTALAPSWEPIILAMKPIDGKFAQNALKHGVAGLNIDGSRIGVESRFSSPEQARKGTFNCSPGSGSEYLGKEVAGRWPKNCILDEESAEMLDRESPFSETHFIETGSDCGGNTYGGTFQTNRGPRGHEDSGGTSRFFYIAKSSSDDRGNREELELPLFDTKEPEFKNTHPTVKPIDLNIRLINLMTYLAKLISTPTGGLLLDPFAGSCSTLVAAKRLGRKAIGIEKEKSYCDIAIKRLEGTWLGLAPMTGTR